MHRRAVLDVSDIEQMHARYNDLVSAVNARDWDMVGSIFTLNAMVSGPEGLPIKGRLGKVQVAFLKEI